jgi:tripartite ATP-independent transporter DctM subunit
MYELIDILPLIMLATLAVGLFSGLPVAILLAGLGVLFSLIGVAMGEMPVVALLNIPLRAISSISNSLIYPAVPMLLFMGVALEKSGIAADLLSCLEYLFRGIPAGMAIAVTLLGIVLAPSAGLVGASVATLALIALPTLLRHGYGPRLASGVISASGTIGLILPPAIMLFFLAQHVRVPIGNIFLSTLLPAAFLALGYICYFVIAYRLRPEASVLAHKKPVEGAVKWAFFLLRGLILPAALIFAVLGSIIFGWATAPQSGAIGAAGGFFLIVLNGRLNWPIFRETIEATVLMTAMVFFIVLAASVFSYPFRYFGGDDLVADLMASIPLGEWGMLLLVLGIIFVLGFFIDWIEITVITLPILMPVLAGLEFAGHLPDTETRGIWIAALLALTLQTSFLTPPFGFALFFLKGAAPPEVRLGDIYRGVVPVIAVQVIGIALVLSWPVLATWLPSLLPK